MNKIGGSNRVREELTAAFAEGRGVTAKVRWVTKSDDEGRNKWIHCTPLLGVNGQVGVWMVIIVNDDRNRKYGAGGAGGRFAPSVPDRTRTGAGSFQGHYGGSNGSGLINGNGVGAGGRGSEDGSRSVTAESQTSLKI
jgi:hypothetical protein